MKGEQGGYIYQQFPPKIFFFQHFTVQVTASNLSNFIERCSPGSKRLGYIA